MEELKYNLISARKARRLLEEEYPKTLYLDYMKNLNDKITNACKVKGDEGVLTASPCIIIKDRVYKELRDAGYTVEEVSETKVKIMWKA